MKGRVVCLHAHSMSELKGAYLLEYICFMTLSYSICECAARNEVISVGVHMHSCMNQGAHTVFP